jgi:ubiquinone/menaquinone biosynthesis C-methylase UbiE
MSYLAKTSYFKGESEKNYTQDRFYGFYGQYIFKKEIIIVRKILSKIKSDSIILDVPCGNGRWWKLLAKKAKKIIACDISPGMIKFASQKKKKIKSNIIIKKVDAENLKIKKKSVDYSFCFALTKHLPRNIQFKVLKELNRVSKKGIICTFPIVNFYTYLIYKIRNKEIRDEVKPIFLNDLKKFLNKSNLKIEYISRITSILGVEHILFLKPKNKK